MQDLEVYPEIEHEATSILRGEYNIPLTVPPKTVLDIGANCGLFSAWAASKWPAARIEAYEPWPESVRMFRRNLKSIEDRVTVHQVAIRAKSGTEKFWPGYNRAMCGFHEKLGRPIKVKCIAASKLPSSEFIKIDTEGCELEILQHLDLSETRGIALESHSSEDASRIEWFLYGHGFRQHSKHATVGNCQLLKFVRAGHEPYPQRCFVAVPIYGSVPAAFMECEQRLIQSPPCHLVVRHLAGDSLVSRARNTLTQQFLESDCSDLLFIDSDLVFHRDHVARIMSHDADIVGGFYPKKQEGPVAWVCNAKLGGGKVRKNGLQEVRYMGTGFLRVRRKVFERLREWREDLFDYNPDGAQWKTEHDFWRVGVYKYPDKTKRYLSEDWFFCQEALDAGFKVYGDTRIILKHIGQATYPLSYQIRQIEQEAK